MKRDARKNGFAAQPSRSRFWPYLSGAGKSYPLTIKDVATTYAQRLNTLTGREGQGTAASINKDRADESIRAELTSTTGQSIGRINKFLTQAEYLSDQCLNKLDQSGADEDFFDAAQPTRRLLVKDMISRGLTQEEIQNEISRDVEEMFQEYERGKKIDRKRWINSLYGTPKEKSAWAPGSRVFGKPQVLIYRRPNGNTPAPKPITPQEIGDRLRELAQELTHIGERIDGNDKRLLQEIGSLVVEMVKLHQSVGCLRESTKERAEHGALH